MTATLIVECDSEEEAANWAGKIVADIEDENVIETNKIILFEADTKVSELKIVGK